MNTLTKLTDDNHEQVRKYLRFFRNKKEGFLRSLNNEFKELNNDKITMEVFSKEDVEDFSDYLRSAVQSLIDSEVGNIINMSSVVISQLLGDAQDKGIALDLETATVENQAVLEAIEKMTLDNIPKHPRRGVGQLTSLKDEAKMIRDESDRVDQTNRELQTQLNETIVRLAEAEKTIRQLGGDTRKFDLESDAKLKNMVQALEDAKEEANKKVSDSTQFIQMKKLMQSQSMKLRELRRRLQQYEPDNGKEEDDD